MNFLVLQSHFLYQVADIFYFILFHYPNFSRFMGLFISGLLCFSCELTGITVKSVLSGHFKKGKTKVLKTDGSLMQVESIAECSLVAFCNTFDLHFAILGLEKQFLVFF